MKKYMVIGEDNFSQKLANELQSEFIRVTLTVFPDREIKTRMDVSSIKKSRDKTALVVIRANRYASNPNDCVLKIILLADTLTRYGVHNKDLVLPYMFYARQDGERLRGESNSLTKIASIYEALKFMHLITINSHLYGKKKPLQKFFKSIKVFDISSASIFANYLRSKDLKNPFVIGPGRGPEKMAMELSNHLQCRFECLPKTRDPISGRVDMEPPKSDLRDKDVIIYDDIASSGGTTEMAYRLSETRFPKSILIVLAHLWTAQGINKLKILSSTELITTNSFVTEHVKNPFTELSFISLLAEQIKKII